MLQWGRDLSIAESVHEPLGVVGPDPLQWGRDLSIAESTSEDFAAKADLLASMGPRSFDRGKASVGVMLSA